MTWRYETHSLEDIYSMLNDKEHVHPDFDTLKIVAKKAYDVAKYFEEHQMSEDTIIQYLNNHLPCDTLCKFGLVSSVLHPDDVDEELRVFSYSHRQWLSKLSRTKLKWTWEEPGVELEDIQTSKLKSLVENYNLLQELALSYDTIP